MINIIRFKIIAGKINKIPEFYTIFARKKARLHNKTTRSRPGRGQMFEAEAEAKILASGQLWPRGLNITVIYMFTVICPLLLFTARLSLLLNQVAAAASLHLPSVNDRRQ